jgi:hypothetical protein
MSDSAWLGCVVVKNVRISMAGMCCDKKTRQIQYSWNVCWSKMSDSAWPECVVDGNVRFSMAGMCRGQNNQIQLGWNVS